MFKQSLKIFKEKFYYFILLDGLFFILLFMFLIYSRTKIRGYLELIQQYIPQLNAIQGLLQESTELTNLQQADLLLNTINTLIKEALIFSYIIIPLVVFIILILLQGLNYRLIFEDKLNKVFNLKFFSKFAIITLPFYIILVLIIIQFLALFSELVPYYGGEFTGDYFLYILIIVPVGLFYFLLIFYSLLNNHKLVTVLKKGLKIGVNKFHKLIFLYLGYIVVLVLFLVAFFNNFVFYIGSFNAFSLINLVVTFLLLVGLSYYRVLFTSFSRS